ncbi:MAG: hypothetical protein ACFE0K_01765 [Alcanivorax sp.]|uniref:hypothetical protein n=1 Tax=Alcanivorax sp. TaxID=1872427 RepID=UPI003DA782D7
MNRIPDDFNLSVLTGRELSQLCIDQYQIQLHFDGATIQGGGEVLLEKGGVSKKMFSGSWITTCGLDVLIGSKVAGWERRDDFHFGLSFSCDATMVFVTQEGPCEDFTILLEGNGFYVL